MGNQEFREVMENGRCQTFAEEILKVTFEILTQGVFDNIKGGVSQGVQTLQQSFEDGTYQRSVELGTDLFGDNIFTGHVLSNRLFNRRHPNGRLYALWNWLNFKADVNPSKYFIGYNGLRTAIIQSSSPYSLLITKRPQIREGFILESSCDFDINVPSVITQQDLLTLREPAFLFLPQGVSDLNSQVHKIVDSFNAESYRSIFGSDSERNDLVVELKQPFPKRKAGLVQTLNS